MSFFEEEFGEADPVPWSEEAELSVLGAMMIEEDALRRMADHLDPEDFHKRAHRLVFAAMRDLFSRGEVVDVTTLTDRLKSADKLEAAGGMPMVAEIVDAVPSAAHVDRHAEIVREKAVLRRLIERTGTIAEEAREAETGELREVLDRAETAVMEVAREMEAGEYSLPSDLVMDVLDTIDREAGQAVTGLSTGFDDLDRETSGLQDGDLAILAGRPSMGKTSLALNIAQHLGIDEGTPVGVFSLEMSEEALVKRLVCSEAGISFHDVRRGNLSDDQYNRLANAAGRVNQAPIPIDDASGLSVLQLRSRARRMVERERAELLVVDYLQLMEGPRSDNRQQEITAISRGLKALAKELDVPVLALSQLSRAPENRENHRPRLSDLRSSGSIEQDADLVMFVYRPEQYMDEQEVRMSEAKGDAEIIIGKQRNGPTGTVHLHFREEIMQFEDQSFREEAA